MNQRPARVVELSAELRHDGTSVFKEPDRVGLDPVGSVRHGPDLVAWIGQPRGAGNHRPPRPLGEGCGEG